MIRIIRESERMMCIGHATPV